MVQDILIVFAKPPVLGKVKTRLAATIGDDLALKLYHKMLDHTLEQALQGFWETHIYWSEPAEVHFDGIAETHLQTNGSLGNKMAHAMEQTFMHYKAKRVVLAGTDCPHFSTKIVQSAFEKLRGNDVVFGPATDGGYYLVGMSAYHPKVFALDKWSHSQVLNQTLSLAKAALLKVEVVSTLQDVDKARDLRNFPQFASYVNRNTK